MSKNRQIFEYATRSNTIPDSYNNPALTHLSKVYSHLGHIQGARHGEEKDTVDSYLDDTSNLLGKIEDNLVDLARQNQWLERDKNTFLHLMEQMCDDFGLQVILLAGDETEIRSWFTTLNLQHTIYNPGPELLVVLYKKDDEMAVKLRWHEQIRTR